ncbi:penicillin-binding protein [Natronosporangium hydrolyticum]|uniref:Penicillin-binding protein n=1 Tax=Natronosporangium hydrolyticum TaxID=2811111 RepID=A0A895YKC5_9ACTN|nr:penicillin-binding transpeptidase domain-containing protein [Natronosporangium hydrolyticum]QSB15949.1 penicillin-binding protein [Natronosporangium hydrolyticum]
MRRRLAASSLVICLVAGLAAACSRDSGAEATLSAFLDGWSEGRAADVPFVTPTGEPVAAEQVTEALAEASGDLHEQPPELTAGELDESGENATAPITVAWPLPGGASWAYETSVRLTERDGDWHVIWQPAVLHPELLDGDQLRLRRLAAARGEILDAAGDPLVTAQPITEVGIWPSQADEVAELADRLTSALAELGHELDLSDLPDRVDEARDDDLFVPVITLRQDEYDEIADEIGDLPGVQTREEERHLAPTRTFARALLGTVGEVTAEVMEQQPGAFAPGDQVGYGGLSGHYDEQLRGVTGQAVVIARPSPGDEVTEIELDRVDPESGQDIATTLDADVQSAAEAALAAESKPAALVAIRISDGSVLAVANTEGDEAHPVNLALTASVPPGSTFKMVSGYQLLAAGELELDSEVPCPEELTIDGFTISNAFSGGRGEVPFQEAMAISCNTAFATVAPQLGDDGLATAAGSLGLGGDWDLGLETFTGSVPAGGSALDQAVAAFGQGQTQVSPAAMAAATAAVARGAWLPPTLVVDPAADQPAPADLSDPAVADLHRALRAVVTGGTAEALADVPGGDVFGKTGTAEAGEETHGWFVGWQDDLAVAVFVVDGRSGSGAAVPLAGEFLRTLAE